MPLIFGISVDVDHCIPSVSYVTRGNHLVTYPIEPEYDGRNQSDPLGVFILQDLQKACNLWRHYRYLFSCA